MMQHWPPRDRWLMNDGKPMDAAFSLIASSGHRPGVQVAEERGEGGAGLLAAVLVCDAWNRMVQSLNTVRGPRSLADRAC